MSRLYNYWVVVRKDNVFYGDVALSLRSPANDFTTFDLTLSEEMRPPITFVQLRNLSDGGKE